MLQPVPQNVVAEAGVHNRVMDPLQNHRLDPRQLLVDDQLAGSLAQNATNLPFEGSSARMAAVEHW
jgi:hypothetical protein